MLIIILETFLMGHILPFQKTDFTLFTSAAFKKTSNRGQMYLYLNKDLHIFAERTESNNSHGFVNIDTTLKLVKNDKVDVRFHGDLYIHDLYNTNYAQIMRQLILKVE